MCSHKEREKYTVPFPGAPVADIPLTKPLTANGRLQPRKCQCFIANHAVPVTVEQHLERKA